MRLSCIGKLSKLFSSVVIDGVYYDLTSQGIDIYDRVLSLCNHALIPHFSPVIQSCSGKQFSDDCQHHQQPDQSMYRKSKNEAYNMCIPVIQVVSQATVIFIGSCNSGHEHESYYIYEPLQEYRNTGSEIKEQQQIKLQPMQLMY